MFPSELKDVFGALSIGVLAYLLIMVHLWVIRTHTNSFVRFLFRIWPKNMGTLSLAVLVCLAFSLGIIVETLTDQLTDTDQPSSGGLLSFVRRVQADCLRTEGQLRFETLFRQQATESGIEYQLTPLGKEYFLQSSDHVVRLLSPLSRERAALLTDPVAYLNGPSALVEGSDKPVDKIETAQRAANALYYAAKNWAYDRDTYFKELEGLQRTIDFARSTFNLCFSGVVILLFLTGPLALLVGMIARERLLIETPQAPLWFGDWRRRQSYRYCIHGLDATLRSALRIPPGLANEQSISRVGARLLAVFAVLSILALLAVRGYRHSENMFNERALGYYVSHIRREADPGAASSRPLTTAIAWQRSSAEYEAVCLEVYRAATRNLAEVMKTQADGRQTLAVVLDLDETVLDNSAFQVYLQRAKLSFSESLWLWWSSTHEPEVRAVPGAAAFLQSARESGIQVYFVSNRDESLRSQTVTSLHRLGLVPTNDATLKQRLLLKSGETLKGARFKRIGKQATILAYFGDQLADFDDSFAVGPDTSVHERRMKLESSEDKLGTAWYVLPNPCYGEWLAARLAEAEFRD